MLSDAAASDDSDIRNTAHHGTTLASAGLAIAERIGASGQDLLGAMVLGYEAGGRLGEARAGGRGGLHASQVVAFSGAAVAGRLLKLTDEQMAHALGIAAITMGGIASGTNSWAREYMDANAAACGVNAALAAGRGYTVNEDMFAAVLHEACRTSNVASPTSGNAAASWRDGLASTHTFRPGVNSRDAGNPCETW